MIDERMQEQASLHVLGALSKEEAVEFKKAMQADPELKEFVSRLSTATGALAGSVPAVEPPPQLRAKILARVAPPQKTVELPARRFRPAFWLPWGLAASLALWCVYLLQQDSRMQQKLGAQALQIDELNQMAESLQAATNDLQKSVLSLRENNRLANLQITMLNSLLADSPKAVAVTLWDNQKQDGVFVVQNLKELPADRDYQLWVLDNGTLPVDAGVFQVNGTGGGRVEFKVKHMIKVAGKFAVTEEVKGGVSSPTLKNMVLLGG
jgi:anti-sigma-K factor RskA